MSRIYLVPYTFVLLNWAAMWALYCFLRTGGLDHLWDSSVHHNRPLSSTPGR
jgi:hypothetical protein